MEAVCWKHCLDQLERDIPRKEFDTWIRPLHAEWDEQELRLLAPNRYVLDHVNQDHLNRILDVWSGLTGEIEPRVLLGIGARGTVVPVQLNNDAPVISEAEKALLDATPVSVESQSYKNPIDPTSRFENYVEGESNRVARSAALSVAKSMADCLSRAPEERGALQSGYNPLYIYGGSGLGKTHLMHAVANHVQELCPQAKVAYVRSEVFVRNMVMSIRHHTMDDFKAYYRSHDVLLIDDIHFLAGKPQSQEEFFHTFNSVLEQGQQMILTCDRYATEIDGMEERLKSRLNGGLPVAIEPPELETRVAILMRKADSEQAELPEDAAFFIARHIQSNVRELEGVLKRVVAFARFRGEQITIENVREGLRDVIAIHDRQVTMDSIQRTVAEACNTTVKDMKSKKRNRAISRPRQIAMALARELTKHSYPEIGEAFGGRDHTTVLHACREIDRIRKEDSEISETYKVLLRQLTR